MAGYRLRRFFLAGGVALIFVSALLAAGIAEGLIVLGPEKAIKKIPTNHKIIALTFDDGPHPSTTGELLAVLDRNQVKATFFVLGANAQKYPQLLAAIAACGHELASHSYTHRIPSRLPPQELLSEVKAAESVIMSVAPRPELFRPPGGGYNDAIVGLLRENGYTTVLWSIDPRDWERRSAAQTAGFVTAKAEPGAIVLLHEGECAANTPAAVETIISRLKEQGYEFVTVGELLQYYEIRQ